MNTITELADYVAEFFKNKGVDVFNSFNNIPVEIQKKDIYAVMSVKEVKADSAVKTYESKLFTAKSVFAIELLCSPLLGISDIYSYFDNMILETLMSNFYIGDFLVKELEYDKTLNKIRLYFQFTLQSMASYVN